VLHTHTLNGVAVSAQKGGVLPLSQQSIFVLASLGYHDYEGVALRDDEKPATGRRPRHQQLPHAAQPRPADRGRRRSADAFLDMYLFESVCSFQVRAPGRQPRARCTWIRASSRAPSSRRRASPGRGRRAP
jgi:hypothetical protein